MEPDANQIQAKDEIKYFKSYDDAIQALNKYFKTVSIEKHPAAMVKLLMDRTADKIFKNFRGSKPSKKLEIQYRDNLTQELRKYYGEWVNVYDFNIKKGRFKSNFEAVYKTEFGRLYGNSPGSIQDHVFYTSHCFEQYKNRSDCYKVFPLLVLAYNRLRNTHPTPADILRFTTLNADQFCWTKKFIYVNVRNGVIVFEKLSGGILIAKTFLLPDMDFPKTGWMETWSYGLNLDPTDISVKLCEKFNKFPIDSPFFPKTDLEYGDYIKTINEQLRSVGLNI
jgi:hypothetical protein